MYDFTHHSQSFVVNCCSFLDILHSFLLYLCLFVTRCGWFVSICVFFCVFVESLRPFSFQFVSLHGKCVALWLDLVSLWSFCVYLRDVVSSDPAHQNSVSTEELVGSGSHIFQTHSLCNSLCVKCKTSWAQRRRSSRINVTLSLFMMLFIRQAC